MAYEDRYTCPACGWTGAVPKGPRDAGKLGCALRAGVVGALVLGPIVGRANLPAWAAALLLVVAGLVAADLVRVAIARRHAIDEARAAGATEVCPSCGGRRLDHERAFVPD